MKRIIRLFVFLSFFQMQAQTTNAPEQKTQFYTKISDIKQKLVDSERFYAKLEKSIHRWPQITCLSSIFKKGDKDPIISTIRKQLILLKIIKNTPEPDNEFFDDTLEIGIKSFQKSHSLNSDGVIGLQTCNQLNITPATRIKAIQQSLQQFDTENPNWGKRYIMVNLPTFDLFAVNNDAIELAQSVIVGSKKRPTPISQYPIQSVVINPSWGVPTSIFIKDKLSKVKEDPEYLERGDYSIYDLNNDPIQAEDVNWDYVSLDYFPYQVRQSPGKKNALGSIKFNLENDQLIYMHGTPETRLFDKEQRGLSSGCIRVFDPISLAVWVLQSDHLTHKRITEKIDTGDTMTLAVKTPVSVFTTNIPVWVSQMGGIQFGLLGESPS
jgi:murein L,D-transpeptidase YcbB/YkuD